jgi:integrase
MRLARNIYHRKDGRFEARYPNGKTPEGKTKYSAVYDKTYAGVKKKRELALIALETPTQQNSIASPTIIEAVEARLESERLRLKPSTIDVYGRYLDCHISPHFGDTHCHALTERHAQEFIDKLLESGLAVTTVQPVFRLLKTSVKAVCGNIFTVKFPKRSKPDIKFMSLNEQKLVEAAAMESGEMNYIAIMLCLYTGIRIGEVAGLMWPDINFDTGYLYINRTMQRIRSRKPGKKTEIVFQPPKTETSKRAFPLPDFLLDILRDFKAKTTTGSVVSYKDKPIEPRTLQNRIKKILEAAGVREMSWHATRHSFAVRMLEKGSDINTLAEVLGHASARITLETYAHTCSDHKRDCMNNLSVVYSTI